MAMCAEDAGNNFNPGALVKPVPPDNGQNSGHCSKQHPHKVGLGFYQTLHTSLHVVAQRV